MKLVVDASVVLPCFVPERFSEAAQSWFDAAHVLLAPDLLTTESASVLRKKHRRGEISLEEAKGILTDIAGGVIELHPSTSLCLAALELSADLDHSLYDCLYLALAEAECADLVTADRAFRQRLVSRRRSIQAYWVEDQVPQLH